MKARWGEAGRFVRQSVERAHPDLCILWPFDAVNAEGYGVVWWEGRTVLAHRAAYMHHHGEAPAAQLDHVCHSVDDDCAGGRSCHHRRCINPYHLEPVSAVENHRRGKAFGLAAQINLAKTHCPHGHPYSGPNLYVRPNGHRACKACGKERTARSRSKELSR